jgi:surfeit locus 1 family protein
VSWRSILGAGVATALGIVLCCGLGVWQLQRLAWKESLITDVETRAHAPAADAPNPRDWPSLKPADYEYRHVRLEGEFDYTRQAFVFRPLGQPRGRYGGPGYLVMTPLKLAGGEWVLVNRGFTPLDRKAGAATGPAAPVAVEGLMRSTEGRTWFTPADDPAKGEWFTRDVEAMAAAMKLGPHAPFSVDADAGPDPVALPEGGETILSFPNNHLSYAFTWFGLAAALFIVFTVWAFTRGRGAASV